MKLEKVYFVGTTVKEWAQCAFWISGCVLCITASYRFLFA
jgi:hypothetical protein